MSRNRPFRKSIIVGVLLLLLCDSRTHAFLPPTTTSTSPTTMTPTTSTRRSTRTTSRTTSTTTTTTTPKSFTTRASRLGAMTTSFSSSSSGSSSGNNNNDFPVLDRWQVMPNGSIIGTVKNHPSIQDGDVITTSPIIDVEAAKSQNIVETASGSQYRLLTPLRQPYNSMGSNNNHNNVNYFSSANTNHNGYKASNTPSLPSTNFPFRPFGGGDGTNNNNNNLNLWPQQQSQQQQRIPPKNAFPKLRWGPAWNQAVAAYRLTQQFIGLDEEYLLAGKPNRSTSGKSSIWEAYAADEATGGLPKIGEPAVCIKVSTNIEAVSREYENYRKLGFLGTARGRFVKCHEFYPVAGYDRKFRNQCALVLEQGSQDLKTYLNSRGRLGGKELRDACMAAAQCVQALHTVGLVWTDLKTENFVVMSNGDVKGIDLESAMAVGDSPVDYSPEACPPEFAAAFLEGVGPYFILDTSYDIWSLGMLMLELSTGEGFFDGNSPPQITRWLRDCDYGIPLDGVNNIDDRLKDLLRRCLQKDPKKRPNMAQVLLHPYFITSPLSIFQNFS